VTTAHEQLPRLQSAWSRSSRLIVLQAVGGAILLWCLVAYSIYRSREDAIQTRRAVMAQTVSAAQEQASQTFTLQRVALQAADRWIAKHPKSNPSYDPEFFQLIDGFKKSSGGRVDVRMVTRDNKLAFAPYRAEAAATDVSDREYVLAQKDPKRRGFHISAPVVGRVNKTWGIPVSVPVSTSEGSIALLFGAIDVDILLKQRGDGAEFAGTTLAWIRDDGTLIARRPFEPQVMGMSVAGTANWRDHLSQRQSGVFISEKSPVDGRAKLLAFSHLDEYPVIVMIAVPLDDVLSPWQRQTAMWLVFALALTAAIGAITYRLIRAVHLGEQALVDLEQANHELMVLSITDKLTQVFNRVKLDEVLRAEMNRASRYGTPLSVALVDLDFFKQVNDDFGHTVGDEVLIRTADILRANVRGEDTVGRWGGEEFMIILPQTEPDQATSVAEKIREAIESENFAHVGRRTASFGVTGFIQGDSEVTILARTDRALYAAKSQGRNRVVADTEMYPLPRKEIQ